MKGIASYIAFVASLAVLASAAPTPARAATVGRTGGELQKRDDSYRRHYYPRYRHHYYPRYRHRYYDDDDDDDDYYWRHHHRPYDYDDGYYDEPGTHTKGTYNFDGIHGSWDSNERK